MIVGQQQQQMNLEQWSRLLICLYHHPSVLAPVQAGEVEHDSGGDIPIHMQWMTGSIRNLCYIRHIHRDVVMHL